MRYILGDGGYIDSVSCNQFECKDKSCMEYTGTIPEGYSSLEEWATTANIRAYYILEGNLVYSAAKDAELQAEWEIPNEAVLYQDSSGTTGSINLNIDKNKFSKLKITARTNTGTWAAAEILTSEAFFNISIVDNNGGGMDAWIKQSTYILNDNEITLQSSLWRNINTGLSGSDTTISIIEVIGIK